MKTHKWIYHLPIHDHKSDKYTHNETVLIDFIYSPDILDLKFGSLTLIQFLEALLLSSGAVGEGFEQSCWVGLETWALTGK